MKAWIFAALAVAACSPDETRTAGASGVSTPAPQTPGQQTPEQQTPEQPTGATTTAGVPPSTTWNIDLENPVDEDAAAAWFDVDLWDNVSSGLVGRLHAKGKKVVCYFSAGSSENWRPDYGSLPTAAIGKGLDGWPGENWLDTTSAGVRAVMRARLDLAKQTGCDGVDPDNVDGFANDSGFPLTDATQLDYNRFLAAEAHGRGLVVGLKNDVDQIATLAPSFDFAVNESCFQYGECDKVAAFIHAGKSVLGIEYGDVAQHQTTVCPKANQLGFFTILSAQDHLDGTYTKCRP